MEFLVQAHEIPPDLVEFFEPAAFGTPPDMWKISSEPLSLPHFAAYPTELVRRCLLAALSEKGYCPKCGAPWARIVEPTEETAQAQTLARNGQDWYARGWDNTEKMALAKTGEKSHGGYASAYRTTGWRPTCSCRPIAEPVPGVVCDPFCGVGTTILTARRMGHNAIGIELSEPYTAMARKRIRDDQPLFNGRIDTAGGAW